MKQGKRLCLHLGMMKLAAATLLFTSSLGVGPDVSAAAAGGEPALKHNGTPAKPPMGPGKVPVDKNGLDPQGRMVAYFGSPVIDGQVDHDWKKAPAVAPKHGSVDPGTSAAFKALWDDRALYILAEVKDKHLSVQSGTHYMQDSLEIFLDENNDKTQEYQVDDLHIRTNYENVLTVDNGDAEQYYTAAKKVEGGYVVEARIALEAIPENGKVLGIELQINDAKGPERIGSLNLFDSSGTAWNDTSKFGEILLAGRTRGDVSGQNPYDLLNLIKSSLRLDFTLYKNSNIVKDALFKTTEGAFLTDDVTQSQLDQQYAALKDAVGKLEMTEEAANEKYFKAVPDAYRMESNKPGTIESLSYKTPNLTQGTDEKKLNVYLPNGYDATDPSKKYNVLYLMHGGGENENLIFGGPGQSKELKKILDHMIENGDIEPLIVVTPSFYGGKNEPAYFHEELIKDIIPLVETKYHTYAQSASVEDIKASRAHRAFGGFSMGSVTTWYTFVHCLDYIKYYLPLSGDSWVMGQAGGGSKPVETAEYLAGAARESGYTPQDYYIFSATGNLDIAYPNMKPQIDAMKQVTDTFIYSSDRNKGNFYFIVADGGTHAWNWVNQYIYDILPDLFVNEE
ncbi:sugar-binding protein [Paenibacillus mucilaginosus]|uniref:Glycoside hydrolase n=1 Tax=Paenibacillus mucilaginosus (strain KNP414) TaxID=1036673 RepID=F8FJM2_PAEMK|nr:sugar-binding protein [Paenibacillus mucilaginosus]AEI42872.1 glycoside hydrolase [Paenibacillus mucilaginosus KNP414]MCG7216499.1 glycoside hydrolase [Paenibacillus mucilaginosus]WDM31038.1 glycoside hydrolase [Paenibacillus mucilaginosus]